MEGRGSRIVQSRSSKQQQTPSNSNEGFRPLTSPVTKIRRNHSPSTSLRRGGVACGRGSVSPRSRVTKRPSPLEKGGVWRTIDDDEVAAGPVLRSPRDNSNDKFQEFRRRWEEKNKGLKRVQTRPVEKVLRAGSGGKEPTDDDGQENGRKVVTKTENTEIDVWEDENDKPPSQLPVLRDPRKEIPFTNPIKENISKQRHDSFEQNRNTMMEKASSVSVKKSGASRPLPLSWQLATTVGSGSHIKVDIPEPPRSTAYGTISFVSPLELSYPLPQTLVSQLHNYAYDAKRRTESSFGSFLLTNSILNPILPTLPRITKPENLIVIEIDPQEKKSSNERENWDPVH